MKKSRITKIIWSVDASNVDAGLDELVKENQEAFDAIRILYEPGKEIGLKKTVTRLGEDQNKRPTLILDISSRVRASVGLSKTVSVKIDQVLKLAKTKKVDADLYVQTEYWDRLFETGATIFLGYGIVVLKVLSIEKDHVTAVVTQGGSVVEGLDLHVPSTRVEASLDDLSKETLLEIISLDPDLLIVPASITQNQRNNLSALCEEKGSTLPWLIAKVNSAVSYQNVDTMLENVEGLFLSRMDLALHLDPASIPMITKNLAEKCGSSAKMFMVASEMLGSMRINPTPTRAEVSDIANAVRDGVDAVVLSEEVMLGKHAARATETLDRVVADADAQLRVGANWQKKLPVIQNEMDALAFAALRTGDRVHAKAIVCLSREGNTARALSSFQPGLPIIAVTFSGKTERRLRIVRAVNAVKLSSDPEIDEVLPVVSRVLGGLGWLKVGDRYIFVTVTVSSLGQESSNLLTIQTMI